MQWYYAVNGRQVGPVEQADLEVLIRDGVVGADDLVWREGMGSDWLKVSQVPELGSAGRLPTTIPQAPPLPAWSDAASFRSTTPNRDLMAGARERLSGKWWLSVGVFAVLTVINAGASYVPFSALVIAGPFALGLSVFILALARKGEVVFEMLFSGFKRFGTALAADLLMKLFILLWSLLLIVPGVLAALSYSMTFFIIRDDPSVGAREAIRRSRRMMAGNRWKYFCLLWRFFGWALLCLLTLGIGFLWLGPYVAVSQAMFYEDLKQERDG